MKTKPETFQDVTPTVSYVQRHQTNERGWQLSAVTAVIFGCPYQGVSVLGPKGETGYFPNLMGLGTENLPLYITKAAERLALQEFTTTQFADEAEKEEAQS